MNKLNNLTIIIVTFLTSKKILLNCLNSIDKRINVVIVENSNNSEFSFSNNLYVTNNLVKLSSIYLVKHFVLLSSDKAVEPSNLMGLSKRISEIIIQNQSHNSDTNFKIVSVIRSFFGTP